MKQVIILALLLQSGLSQASTKLPTLSELMHCTNSVFYGEVVSGKFTKSKSYIPNSKEATEGYGTYKIKVIKHIAGEKLLNQITIQAGYFNSLGGGAIKYYPAPGRKYIFIAAKDGRNLKFSPHHLPEVEYIQGQVVVTGGQHSFVEGIKYYYKLNGDQLKAWSKNPGIRDDNFVGYSLDSYENYIATFFAKCPSNK